LRNRSCQTLALAIFPLLSSLPVPGHAEPLGAVRTPLAAGRLDSVVGMPLYFRLYRARLPPAGHAAYEGVNALLYELSGAASLEIQGGATQPVANGDGAFIAAGQIVTIRASTAAPADLLLFLLTARPNQRRPLLDRPAVIRELFRTPDPLPGLQEGPYEFSLARLTLPAGTPADPAYSRSGAALDYVLAGTAALTADGKTETISAEMPFFERFGWVHSLANSGAVPLVLVEANISQEGVAAGHSAADK